ncbi:polysaccharide deacetylase family protein [Bacillus sp. AK128]
MKRISVSMLIFLCLLSACTEDTNQSNNDKDPVNETPSEVEGENEKDEMKESETPQSNNENQDRLTKELEENIAEEPNQPLEPLYKINEANWSVDPIGDANDKVILLTIDDAPDQYALEMATLLKELKVPAIFFVNGHFIDSPEEKERLKQIYELGFPIGNHTWSHKNLKELSEEEQYKEIMSLSDEIEVITGERPKFFRAPFGSNTDHARKLVNVDSMVLMNWTYGYDFMKEYMNKEALTDIMIHTNLLTNGANLLMHDREWTYQALPDIINGLREKGYEFVNPELIQTP